MVHSLPKTAARRAMTTSSVTRHEFFTPAFYNAVNRPSKIMFGNNSEHVDVEKLLLKTLKEERPNERFRAMMICGGGDNFISILADSSVESFTCVDASPYQLALGRLKLALACSDLSTEQALGFLGMNDSVGYRVEVYEKVLAPQLPSDVRDLIQQDLMHEIATGVAHFGPGENCYRHMSKILDDMGFDVESVWNGTVDLPAFKQVCHDGIGTRRALIEASLVTETLPEEVVPLYIEAMEGELYAKACQGLHRLVAGGNYNNHIAAMQILNRYDEDSLPEWLLPNVREALREKKSQVTFVKALLQEVPASNEKYHLISTSNIFDWLEPQEAAESLDTIADKFLAPDGYMLVRMGIRSLDNVLQVLQKLQPCDKITPKQMAEQDKVQVFYQQTDCFAALRHSSVV